MPACYQSIDQSVFTPVYAELVAEANIHLVVNHLLILVVFLQHSEELNDVGVLL